METSEYLTAIARESAALADAAERAGLEAPVPSCPGWTVADLVEHVGNVQAWARATVDALAPERVSRSALSASPSPDELVPWFRATSGALVATLSAADPGAPVWTWTADRTVNFWFRRQAHEAAIHRFDAELASGTHDPIDSALAADGVDEHLFMVLSRAGVLEGDGETVHLHCTDVADGGGEWLVTLTPEAPRIERVHAKGDVAARGSASDLDLFLWGRVSVGDLEVFGDRALLERLQAAAQV